MIKPKTVKESIITMTELVLPHYTNLLGKLLGGQLMHWIDICAALSAAKHTQNICVTASVDKIDFIHSINLGNAVTLTANVNRVFNTSMDISVEVYSESYQEGKRIHSNTAFLTFVSVDNYGNPIKAVEIIPETDEEKKRYEEALQRRENRLRERTKV